MGKPYWLLRFVGLLAVPPAWAQAHYIPPETFIQDNITYTVHWDGSYDYEEAVTLRLNTGQAVQNVRRQNLWHRSRRKLEESGPRLGFNLKRLAYDAASGDVRWSAA